MDSISRSLQQRLQAIQPFLAMELVKQADALKSAGHDMIYLAIGEPDFTAPEVVQRAAYAAIQRGDTGYTPALGLWPLREKIADFYAHAYGLSVDPRRIVITAGASGALLLACAALVGAGDEVLMPDPSYPCNRHFVAAFDGIARLIDCGPEQRYQLSAKQVQHHWQASTRGVLIASPSNPTGTSISTIELHQIIGLVKQRGGFVLVDEIYQGLSYDVSHSSGNYGFPDSALSLDPDVITLNSFSKFFCMTGWRLGWLVVPESLVAVFEKLAQNLFICPSTIAQHAAMACFSDEALDIYRQRRDEFKRRRDFLVPAFESLGLSIPVLPDGAFYLWTDVRQVADNSQELAQRAMQQAHVVLVPGADFGQAQTQYYIRASYATAFSRLQEAVDRLSRLLN
jgi:aspartate/methionine/tyrosine aminotransferase